MNEKTFCTMCGAENEKGAKFCVSCGNKLEMPAEEAVKEVVAEAPTTEQGMNVDAEVQTDAVSTTEGEATVEPTATYSQPTTTYSQPATTYYYAEPEPTKAGGYQGFAIASLICGIVALICCPLACCGCCFKVFEWLLVIAAIALGIVTIVKAYAGKGMAIVGIVCGGIALLGLLMALIVPAATGAAMSDICSEILGEDYMNELEDIFEDAMEESGYYY